MVVAAEVCRDEQGIWVHPSLIRSGCKTPAEFSDWLSINRLELYAMSLRDEAPAGGAQDARDWIPEPPDDEGWFMGSVHDTADGPVCYWFRNY
ncbi:hypothetical protein [Enterobacter sp. 18A13]|uniref:hypothetical protein n=1 Tax=Enterobacter sp. 18A13 TaxID=2565914 RepID=UPI0011776EA8|nr:hypothetical protein [Enterobacter sp. 18A13]